MKMSAFVAPRMDKALRVAAVVLCGFLCDFGCASSASPSDAAMPNGGAGTKGAGGMGGSTDHTDASGVAGTSGGAGTSGAGTSGAGTSGGAGVTGAAGSGGDCPTAAPFDDSSPAMIAACTVPIAVAVGNGLRRASTRDGMTWDHDVYLPDTSVTDQNENSHRDVLVARGLILVVGDGGLLVSADGGETFTVARAGRFHDSALAYFHGTIWLISNLGTFSSTDGKTWMEYSGTTMLPGNLPGEFAPTAGAAAASGSLLVVLGGRNTTSRVFDGTTWAQHDFDKTMYGTLNSLAYGNGRFVLLGGACCDKTPFAGLRAASPDGVAWTVTTNVSAGAAPTLRFGNVLWQGTQFFATASQYDKRTFTSTDGLAWTAQATNAALGSVTQLKGAYQAVGGVMIYRSTDGVAWSSVHTGIGDPKWGYTVIRSGAVLPR